MNKNKNLWITLALVAAFAFSSCKTYVAPYDGPTTSSLDAQLDNKKS